MEAVAGMSGKGGALSEMACLSNAGRCCAMDSPSLCEDFFGVEVSEWVRVPRCECPREESLIGVCDVAVGGCSARAGGMAMMSAVTVVASDLHDLSPAYSYDSGSDEADESVEWSVGSLSECWCEAMGS